MSTGKLFASLGYQAVCCGFSLSLGVGSIGVELVFVIYFVGVSQERTVQKQNRRQFCVVGV